MIEQFKKKLPETIQAQIELFASLGIVPHIDTSEELEEKSKKQVELRKQEDFNVFGIPDDAMPFSRYYAELEQQAKILRYSRLFSKIKDIKNIPTDIPTELKPLIEGYYTKYSSFLKKEKLAMRDYLENNIKNYNLLFKDSVDKIKQEIRENSDIKQTSKYLSQGTQNWVFKIEVREKKYVVKIPKPDYAVEVTVIMEEIQALIRGLNIENLSHLNGYSYPDGIVVIDFLEGASLEGITKEEITKIDDSTIVSLINTVKEMVSKGIRPDIGSKGNFIFSEKDNAIKVIDYHLVEMNYKISSFKDFCLSIFGNNKKDLIESQFLDNNI